MIPRLGKNYGVNVEAISKPRSEYQDEAYKKLGLPAAPAIMVDDEQVVQGRDIEEGEVETVIRRHLGLTDIRQSKG